MFALVTVALGLLTALLQYLFKKSLEMTSLFSVSRLRKQSEKINLYQNLRKEADSEYSKTKYQILIHNAENSLFEKQIKDKTKRFKISPKTRLWRIFIALGLAVIFYTVIKNIIYRFSLGEMENGILYTIGLIFFYSYSAYFGYQIGGILTYIEFRRKNTDAAQSTSLDATNPVVSDVEVINKLTEILPVADRLMIVKQFLKCKEEIVQVQGNAERSLAFAEKTMAEREASKEKSDIEERRLKEENESQANHIKLLQAERDLYKSVYFVNYKNDELNA